MKLMKCGHVENSLTMDGRPACSICSCYEPLREADGTDGIDGRKAICGVCGNLVLSNWSLALFKYQPDMETDSFYCGCDGWD